MIRRLRRRHLRLMLILAVFLPALLIAALAARRAPPRQSIPPELAAP